MGGKLERRGIYKNEILAPVSTDALNEVSWILIGMPLEFKEDISLILMLEFFGWGFTNGVPCPFESKHPGPI